jgi:hypothetical protein
MGHRSSSIDSAGQFMGPGANLHTYVENLQAELDRLRAALNSGQQEPAESLQVHPRAVRLTLRARRAREAIFGEGLFADPAWDMLLEAYSSTLAQQRLCITDLCNAAAVPNTTALRWLRKLEDDGWLRRKSDPLDARRIWVELTGKGVTAMQRLAGESPLGWPM